MYICKYVCKYLDLIWCIDCVFVTRKKTYFSKILSLIFALSWPGDTGCCGNGEARDREGRDNCFFNVFFQFLFFLGKAIFPPKYLLVKKKSKQVMDIGVGIYGVNTGY